MTWLVGDEHVVSQRKEVMKNTFDISRPPYNYPGLPFHRCFAADVADLPGKPVELVFDLHPLSNIFDAGSRIRITITCADKDNTLTPMFAPPPKVSVYRNTRLPQHSSTATLVYRNTRYPSRITLPVIPAALVGRR
jgi:predicted acyl esterase